MLLVEMRFCSSELGLMGIVGREVRMNDDVYVIERIDGIWFDKPKAQRAERAFIGGV